MKQEIGTLRYLYLEEIELQESIEVAEFLVMGAAKAILATNNRNWIPLIVTQTALEKYQVIGNAFVYQVAVEAALEKVWCIIADDSPETLETTKLLAQEKLPQIDLATATREEIKAGLEYLINRANNPLKGVKLASAIDRIDSAPRQYWQKSLIDVTSLKCGITGGTKLNIFKEIFYVTPQPLPEVITDESLLQNFNTTELKNMAKKRKLSGYSKMKKLELVKLLSQQ